MSALKSVSYLDERKIDHFEMKLDITLYMLESLSVGIFFLSYSTSH